MISNTYPRCRTLFKVHALLCQWQYSGQAAKTNLQNSCTTSSWSRWTQSEPSHPNSLGRAWIQPPQRDFFGCWGDPQPQIPTWPQSCRAETWGCRGLASRPIARKSKPIKLQLLKTPQILQERTVCGNGGCFGKWWPVIKPKSCYLFNWFVARGIILSRTAHCQPQTIVKCISCDAVVCILNLALAFVSCSKASLS